MSRPRRRGRDIHGVLLLDKPQGLSSNDALQKVKRLYNANRAGHTGALDPLATGMLPICLGEATKFSQFLLDSDKRYRVIARLGQRTDTSDADGQIVQERPVSFTQAQLDAALDSFRGDIKQVPSMYSALKYQGKKLYEYARQGIEVPREARSITVYELQFIRWEGDELELEIHCSKGTYIRTITDDLGELLGCGAHVIYLRRLQVATYPTERMVTLEQLNELLEQAHRQEIAPAELLDPLLMPMDSPVENYPEVNLLPVVAGYVKQGQPVQVAGAPASGMVRITEGEERKFIGVGDIADDGRVAPRRLVVEYFD
ncbi:tRNA pseudouridine synthase B [Serratia quinivorans]|jgi:tRNA pseudouridine55 synthase|uniref:tRNA pseudouridine synthase B n=3 Tax=Serratia TaxID=613 RepID=TRUB_SERP5|nr:MULTISPECIES: tRNA pseudouridine(55) synthase TruB [Serratia]A8G909.1 RecName: Full=tRNA pseudouridine synthase B; AltName: Full=tRNA pseudouridine(55) synthase; Short=Psi55 synthase; AltName: Full=tRNA pseudouridylate synthase; AltName: Full=tRNA-uridine isomerase [Serratia proteamaculans 568]MBV6693045.1 tRNA pseudouridine(55) synthase TruB [Serratia quinivorans]QBX67258.1 tRNA pseudouridine(55) synthase TruB [Serratia quinivorans]QGH60883.1 tRNA pseudouridine(55) synthase TruB [Serratia p